MIVIALALMASPAKLDAIGYVADVSTAYGACERYVEPSQREARWNDIKISFSKQGANSAEILNFMDQSRASGHTLNFSRYVCERMLQRVASPSYQAKFDR